MVDEEAAVEVIDLVLNADGEQAVGVELEARAVAIECPHPDSICTSHGFEESRDGETALVHLFLTLAIDDLRVDKA